MANLIKTHDTLVACLTDEVLDSGRPAGGVFAIPLLHLYKNDFTPDVNTVISDLVEADYTGYAAQTIVWATPVVWDPPDARALGAPLIFVNVDILMSQNVYGWYLTRGVAPGDLLGVGRFDGAPLTLLPAGSLPLFPELLLRNF